MFQLFAFVLTILFNHQAEPVVQMKPSLEQAVMQGIACGALTNDRQWVEATLRFHAATDHQVERAERLPAMKGQAWEKEARSLALEIAEN